MGSDGLPMEVQRLIQEHFETNTDVDVLLLVHRRPERRWEPSGVADILRIHPDQAKWILARLAAGGLLRSEGTGYRYRPHPPEVAGAVEALAGLHPTYRVAIAAQIFSAAADRKT